MAEKQLREAFALMKEGKKQEAAKIARAILKDDRNNVGAWWMMANVIEEEDKQIRALERVLKLNPDHKGAKLKIQQLMPGQDADLSDAMATQEVLNLDWSKLKDDPHPDKSGKKELSHDDHRIARLGMLAMGGFILLVIIIASGFMVWNSEFIQGPGPEKVVTEYMTAFSTLNFDQLASLTCLEYREQLTAAQDQINREFAQMGGGQDFTMDFSTVTASLKSKDATTAQVNLGGSFTIMAAGVSMSFDLAETGGLIGEDLVVSLIREEDAWRICEPVE